MGLLLSNSFAAVGHGLALSNSFGAFRFQLLRCLGARKDVAVENWILGKSKTRLTWNFHVN